MRIEKGHVAGGELNGQTTARDLGLGKMVSTKKDFIGRVMAERPALVDPDRPRLVGFRTLDPADKVGGGAHFLDVGAAATAENDLGHVTSVCWSPLFERWIGLGLIRRGAARHRRDRPRLGRRARPRRARGALPPLLLRPRGRAPAWLTPPIRRAAPRSAFHGLLHPGRHGRTDGPAGLVVRERTGLALVTLIARNGKAGGAGRRRPRRARARTAAAEPAGRGRALFGALGRPGPVARYPPSRMRPTASPARDRRAGAGPRARRRPVGRARRAGPLRSARARRAGPRHRRRPASPRLRPRLRGAHHGRPCRRDALAGATTRRPTASPLPRLRRQPVAMAGGDRRNTASLRPSRHAASTGHVSSSLVAAPFPDRITLQL